MTNSQWKNQLTPRSQFTLSQGEDENLANHLFLQSPSDWGVMRNGGKNGARFAPSVLLSNFKKMAKHEKDSPWRSITVSSQNLEGQDFIQAQLDSSKKISSALSAHDKLKSVIHFAAGHDHVYPLAKSIIEKYGKAIIINIDAHLDTRSDELPHSGTPFRQLYKDFGSKMTLTQVGIHDYANVAANYEGMDQMNILTMEEITDSRSLKSWLDKVLCMDMGPLILSLDCDGLDGSIMPAVSAANHHGLDKFQMNMILEASIKYWSKYQHPRIFGVYEYNPLFDDLHTTSGRYLASLIHKVYRA